MVVRLYGPNGGRERVTELTPDDNEVIGFGISGAEVDVHCSDQCAEEIAWGLHCGKK